MKRTVGRLDTHVFSALLGGDNAGSALNGGRGGGGLHSMRERQAGSAITYLLPFDAGCGACLAAGGHKRNWPCTVLSLVTRWLSLLKYG